MVYVCHKITQKLLHRFNRNYKIDESLFKLRQTQSDNRRNTLTSGQLSQRVGYPEASSVVF